MEKSKSHLGQVINALQILDGVDEPLDSTTLAELIGLTTEQVSASLSLLHRTGYMKRVGRTASGYALYLQCKPIGVTPAEIRRMYKNTLRQERLDYKAIQREVASKIARVTIRAIESELKKQILPNNKIQLSLPL